MNHCSKKMKNAAVYVPDQTDAVLGCIGMGYTPSVMCSVAHAARSDQCGLNFVSRRLMLVGRSIGLRIQTPYLFVTRLISYLRLCSHTLSNPLWASFAFDIFSWELRAPAALLRHWFCFGYAPQSLILLWWSLSLISLHSSFPLCDCQPFAVLLGASMRLWVLIGTHLCFWCLLGAS